MALKIKMQDEGDMITMVDQEDLDLLLMASREIARREGSEMGKMEVRSIPSISTINVLTRNLDMGGRTTDDLMIALYPAYASVYISVIPVMIPLLIYPLNCTSCTRSLHQIDPVVGHGDHGIAQSPYFQLSISAAPLNVNINITARPSQDHAPIANQPT
jgi:hypothetical protein